MCSYDYDPGAVWRLEAQAPISADRAGGAAIYIQASVCASGCREAFEDVLREEGGDEGEECDDGPDSAREGGRITERGPEEEPADGGEGDERVHVEDGTVLSFQTGPDQAFDGLRPGFRFFGSASAVFVHLFGEFV